MDKGVMSVIASLLILMVTLAIIGMATLYAYRATQLTTNAAQSAYSTTQQQISYNFRIENVDYVSSVINVRNVGNAKLDNLGVYLDNNPIAASYSPIDSNTLGDIFLAQPIPEGTHTLKITAGLAEQTIKFDVPSSWFAGFNITGS